MFVKDAGGNYQNLNNANLESVGVDQESGTWYMYAVYRVEQANIIKIKLAGSWASDSAAKEAVRELVDGVDPSGYGD